MPECLVFPMRAQCVTQEIGGKFYARVSLTTIVAVLEAETGRKVNHWTSCTSPVRIRCIYARIAGDQLHVHVRREDLFDLVERGPLCWLEELKVMEATG